MDLDWALPARLTEQPSQRAPVTIEVDLGEHGWELLSVQAWEDSQNGRWRGTRAGSERARALNAKEPRLNNDLAWFLATCPDERLRDIPRSVELARKALTLAAE